MIARRRQVGILLGVAALVGGVFVAPALGTVSPADAAPSATPSPQAGTKVCTFGDDNRLTGVTGMVATSKGYDVVNDTDSSGTSIYRLNTKTCSIDSSAGDQRSPQDAEDLGATPNGNRWVADTGDADQNRQTVALWEFPKGSSQATTFQLSYPSDAAGANAKSLLMQPDGTPVLITSQAGGGTVYVPDGKLNAAATTSLRKVGDITLTSSGTSGGPLGPGGQRVFTGGAVAPDGKRVVLRTYTDAYEWDVTGGDVAQSIVSGKPRRTPLPNEPGGEAISYTPDGSGYLTVSDTGTGAKILRYAPAAAAVPTHGSKPTKADDGGLFSQPLTQTDIIRMIVGVGVAGLLLVIVGIVGIRRSRRRPPEGAPGGDRPSTSRGGSGAGRPPSDAETVVLSAVRSGPDPRRQQGHRPPPDDDYREPMPQRRSRHAESAAPDAETSFIEKVGGPASGGAAASRSPYGERPPYGDGAADRRSGYEGAGYTGRAGADERAAHEGRPGTERRGERTRRGETAPLSERPQRLPYEGRAGYDTRQPQPDRPAYGGRSGYEPRADRENPTTYGSARADRPRHADQPAPDDRGYEDRPPRAERPRGDRSQRDIDWLDDVRDGAGPGATPPPRRDPPDEQPSGNIRRRLR